MARDCPKCTLLSTQNLRDRPRAAATTAARKATSLGTAPRRRRRKEAREEAKEEVVTVEVREEAGPPPLSATSATRWATSPGIVLVPIYPHSQKQLRESDTVIFIKSSYLSTYYQPI